MNLNPMMNEPTTPSTLLNLDGVGLSPSTTPRQSYRTATGSDGMTYHVLRTPTKGDMPNISTKEPLSISFSPSKVLISKNQSATTPRVYKQLISRPADNGQTGGKVQYLRVLTSQSENRNSGQSPTTAVRYTSQGQSNTTATVIRHTPGQRLILPADNQNLSITSDTQQLTLLDVKGQLQQGVTLLSNNHTSVIGENRQNHMYAFLPSNVQIPKPVQQLETSAMLAAYQENTTPVPLQHQTSSLANPKLTSQTAAGSAQDAANKQKKPCNCTKSQCLKLYCDCFANGEFCSGCNCQNCYNNLEHEEERQRAVKQCLERNPHAFHPKIGKGNKKDSRRHQKGCNCKRSGCLKNYCECYEAKIPCSVMCKCVGCKNYEENSDKKNLLSLAEAAETRKAQQLAVSNKLPAGYTHISHQALAPSNLNFMLPHNYLKKPVVEAIMDCLLTQCREAEAAKCKDNTTEKVVLEEFGRCLHELINASNIQGH